MQKNSRDLKTHTTAEYHYATILYIKELIYASLHLEGCCNNYILILHIIMPKQKYHAVNVPYYKHIIDRFLHETFNS